MQGQDLSLVAIEEIIEELHKRYDIFIFSGMQIRGGPDKDILTIRKWAGNKATCAGLASQIQIAIYDLHMEEDDIDDKPFEQ